jgi:hypothetical protein
MNLFDVLAAGNAWHRCEKSSRIIVLSAGWFGAIYTCPGCSGSWTTVELTSWPEKRLAAEFSATPIPTESLEVLVWKTAPGKVRYVSAVSKAEANREKYERFKY